MKLTIFDIILKLLLCLLINTESGNYTEDRGKQVLFWQYIITIIICELQGTLSLYCDKIFTYYEEYGQNSFNVTCNGITKGYEHILENIMINNEISLTISNSVLENLTPNIFKNVRSIKMLSISNSTFEFDRKLAIFNKLTHLENLIVEDTRFDVDVTTLKGLSNLRVLTLYNNSLASIKRGGFIDLVNLEKLEVVNNHVKNLDDLQLCELQRLKTLNLRHNLLSNINMFYFFCRRNHQNIDFNINDMPALPTIYKSYFLNVTTISYDLLELDLSYNQILDVGYSLEGLSKLKIIKLSFNGLSVIRFIHFKSLSRLEKFILNNNRIHTFESKVLENKTSLRHLDLSYNLLKEINISNVPSLEKIDLSFNNLTVISLRNLTRVKEINLNHNNLQYLAPNTFQKVLRLVDLNLADNNLNLTQGLFKELQGLRVLRLSNNSLTNVPEKAFVGLKNLRILDLSNNKIVSLNVNTFHDLENLEILNLSSNSIESLAYLSVEPLKNLRNLDVAANKLQYIEYDIILSKLPSLMNINIKSNLLTCGSLSKIITFLKQRHISYTNSERMDLAKMSQNVAGIPCRMASSNLILAVGSQNEGNPALLNFGIVILTVLIAILTGIVTYKFYIYLKRRKYRADEFELVDE